MITHEKTIDHENPLAKKQFDRAVKNWRRECIESVVSRRAWRKGGRTLRRELKRRGCKVDRKEIERTMLLAFIDKGAVKGRLIVTFENYEPEPATS